mmetsp:Transcript_13624/g.20742  ORF Transcript_13624/g.20742 Transcript_13624/m.20742 type:complete len:332 (-) Transcript_13624:88-1083(-)
MPSGIKNYMQPLRLLKCLLFLSTVSCFTVIPHSSQPHLLPSRTITPITELWAKQKGGRRYQPRVVEVKPTMNDEITYSELRVQAVSTSGGKDEPLGIMSKADALAKAQELGGLDLILINENSDPPVCKIVDYSKYRYMKEKKAKEVKKNSKASELKEVKMSYKIDVHDYQVRKKNASKFLTQGNRVKCTVMFRGREVQHDKLGFELLDKLAGDLDEVGLREGKAKKEGRSLFCILSPRPEVMKAVSDGKRNQEKMKKKKKEEAFKERKESLASSQEESVSADVRILAEFPEEEETDLLGSLLDEDDDDDDDVESSLDALLGSDDLTDDLFS